MADDAVKTSQGTRRRRFEQKIHWKTEEKKV